jgi:hypothetical protein
VGNDFGDTANSFGSTLTKDQTLPSFQIFRVLDKSEKNDSVLGDGKNPTRQNYLSTFKGYTVGIRKPDILIPEKFENRIFSVPVIKWCTYMARKPVW